MGGKKVPNTNQSDERIAKGRKAQLPLHGRVQGCPLPPLSFDASGTGWTLLILFIQVGTEKGSTKELAAFYKSVS